MKLQLGPKTIEIERVDSKTLRVDGKLYLVDGHEYEPGTWSIIIDGRPLTLSTTIDGSKLQIHHQQQAFEVSLGEENDWPGSPDASTSTEEKIFAKMPGKILHVAVSLGQETKIGEKLLVLEAMKMENEIHAPFQGVISELLVKSGDVVSANQHLLTLSPRKEEHQ